jgi:hypothetical protein
MFQYACARAIAERTNGKLLLDLHDLLRREPRPGFVYRDYELNRFRVAQNFASCADVAAIGFGTFERIKARVMGRSARWQRRYFEPLPGAFRNELLTSCRSMYLDGYLQDCRYFESIGGIIRRDHSKGV